MTRADFAAGCEQSVRETLSDSSPSEPCSGDEMVFAVADTVSNSSATGL